MMNKLQCGGQINHNYCILMHCDKENIFVIHKNKFGIN